MHSFIREHTAGSVIRGAFAIYFRHFLALVTVYFIPVTPFVVFQTIAMAEGEPGFVLVSVLLGIIASLFATAAITMLISDVCLGNQISILRYYKRVFGVLVTKLFATSLLQMLALAIAAVLLVIPFFFALMWFMFATTVVVLEDTWGVQALKRSKQLGTTKHWRNFGVFLLVTAVGSLIGALFGGIAGIITAGNVAGLGFQIAMTILQQLLVPVTLIVIVLLYYDLSAMAGTSGFVHKNQR
jgi:hypothetical protein